MGENLNMAEFVKIYWRASTPQPGLRKTNNIAMIGRSTTTPSENPFYTTSLQDVLDKGISVSEQAYMAAQSFFANTVRAGLWIYIISGDGEGKDNITFTGPNDGKNKTYYCPYAPVTDISNVEVKHLNEWKDCPDESGFYDLGTTNDILNGSLTFTDIGPYWSGITGFYLSPEDSVRADITITPLASAFQGLSEKEFAAFFFGYNQSMAQPLPPTDQEYKYGTDYVYNSKSWLNDVLNGAIMATQFNAVGNRSQFFFGLPDKVRETDTIGNYYGSGTAYTGSMYGDLPNIIGANIYTQGFSAKQTTDGKDIAAMAAATMMNESPRSSLTYAFPVSYSQIDYPQASERVGWIKAKINPLIQVKHGTNLLTCFGGNLTFGVSGTHESNINYIRCKNLLSYALGDNLQVLLLSKNPQLKYDAEGVGRIRSVIYATLIWAKNKGYIDDLKSIEIPIEQYVNNEDSLTEGETAILLAARATKVVNDITITYLWKGEIVEIVINALVSE